MDGGESIWTLSALDPTRRIHAPAWCLADLFLTPTSLEKHLSWLPLLPSRTCSVSARAPCHPFRHHRSSLPSAWPVHPTLHPPSHTCALLPSDHVESTFGCDASQPCGSDERHRRRRRCARARVPRLPRERGGGGRSFLRDWHCCRCVRGDPGPSCRKKSRWWRCSRPTHVVWPTCSMSR